METEWTHAEAEASDKLAKLHHFSMIKEQDGQEIGVHHYRP